MSCNRGLNRLVVMFALAVFCLVFSVSEAAEVSAILSSEAEPYRRALTGFRKAFEEKKVPLSLNEHMLGHERADSTAQRVLQKRPDLVFTLGTKATGVARERIANIPVVFSMVLSPDQSGAKNLSGVSLDIPAVMKLQGVRRVLPRARRIGLLYSPETKEIFREFQHASREMDFILIASKIESGKEFSSALEEIMGKSDVFLMIPDSMLYFPESVKYLLTESFHHGLPVVGISSATTRAGALISFECDYEDTGRHAGEIAMRILAGSKATDVEIARPRKVRFSVNRAAASRLNIRIPAALLNEASEVMGR